VDTADIIYVGYNIHPGVSTHLINFVKNKQGVLIFAGETYEAVDAEMIKAITGATTAPTIVNGPGTGAVYQFLDVPKDPIMYGHFGSCVGKYWGGDAAGNNYLSQYDASRFITYTRFGDTYPNCFRDKVLGFIYMGDGGFVSNLPTGTDATSYPFRIDANKLPAAKTNYSQPVWNSLFIANSVWWAIDFLRKNGRID
jgi:hypothetical protein